MLAKLEENLILVGIGVGLVALVAVFFAGKKALAVAATAANAVNPLNHDNVIASGVNNLGATITGDTSFTLGGALYDLTHSDPTKPAPKPDATPAIDSPIIGAGA